MTPSTSHLEHLKYIRSKMFTFFSDPNNSLFGMIKSLEFMDEEILRYETIMEEGVQEEVQNWIKNEESTEEI